jgi:nucleoid-associated protein EbfC
MNPKNMQNLMKQAQKMQEKLQAEMAELRVEGSAGGGIITVVMDGSKQLMSVTINPEAVDPEDTEMLQDLIVAAVNEAVRKVDEKLNAQIGGLSGGLLGGF